MRNIKYVTKKQLIQILLEWKYGAQPASIQYLTTPTINKEGLEKFGTVFKLANVGVMLGYIYENSVNNELKKQSIEQGFLSQPLWKGKGKRLNPVLAKHIENHNIYISYKYQQTFRSYFFDDKLNKLNYSDLQNYLKGNNRPEKLIEHREISIDNIKKLKFKKTTYIIKG